MDTPRLDTVMKHIKKHYVFPDDYDTLAKYAPGEKRVCVLNHTSLSITESLGKIASEQRKYGMLREDSETLKEEIAKIFVNSLVMAAELGMSPNTVCKKVFESYEK